MMDERPARGRDPTQLSKKAGLTDYNKLFFLLSRRVQHGRTIR